MGYHVVTHDDFLVGGEIDTICDRGYRLHSVISKPALPGRVTFCYIFEPLTEITVSGVDMTAIPVHTFKPPWED